MEVSQTAIASRGEGEGENIRDVGQVHVVSGPDLGHGLDTLNTCLSLLGDLLAGVGLMARFSRVWVGLFSDSGLLVIGVMLNLLDNIGRSRIAAQLVEKTPHGGGGIRLSSRCEEL